MRKNHFPLKLPLPSIAESLQARWVCQADSKLLPSWTLRISPPPKDFTWSFFFLKPRAPLCLGNLRVQTIACHLATVQLLASNHEVISTPKEAVYSSGASAIFLSTLLFT